MREDSLQLLHVIDHMTDKVAISVHHPTMERHQVPLIFSKKTIPTNKLKILEDQHTPVGRW